MSKLSDILRKHQNGEPEKARSEVILYIQELQGGIDSEWELDQAHGVLEVIIESMGLPIDEVQADGSAFRRSKFQYWANAFCSDRSRKLPRRIDQDDKAAFQEAQKVLALSGIIGFTSPFMEDMCKSMDDYQRRSAEQDDPEGTPLRGAPDL